jgi:ankyrin repeat protein
MRNESLLIVACNKNKEAVVKPLLSNEACDVNIIDCFNLNALHYACRTGQADVVKLLLSNEACDVNIIDCFNLNALHYACRTGQADVVIIFTSQASLLSNGLTTASLFLLQATINRLWFVLG